MGNIGRCVERAVERREMRAGAGLSRLAGLVLVLVGCGRSLPPAPPAPLLGVPVSSAPAPTGAATAGGPQISGEPLVLDRQTCIEQALAANRGYLQKRGARENSALGLTVARAEYLHPTLQATYTKTVDDFDGGTGRVQAPLPIVGFTLTPYATSTWNEGVAGGEYSSAVGVALSRRVLALAEHVRQRLPVSQAEVDFLAAAGDLLIAAKQLELDAIRSWHAIGTARARATVREARVRDAREFLSFVERAVEQGFRAPVETLVARISLNQAEADLLRERAGERDAVERLLILLAQPLDRRLTLTGEVSLPELPTNFAADLTRLLATHEELVTVDARLALLDDRVRVARDDLAPELTATLSAERRTTGPTPFAGDVTDEDVVAMRLDLSMPLDLQRAQRARYLQAKRNLRDARIARQETAARLEQQLRSAWRRLDRARAEVELASVRAESERGRLTATLARYDAGTVDNLEVARAKQAVDESEVNLFDARGDAAIAAAEYRALLPAAMEPGQ